MEERLQVGTDKWRKELFEGCCEDMEEDKIQSEQNWKTTLPDKWVPGQNSVGEMEVESGVEQDGDYDGSRSVP